MLTKISAVAGSALLALAAPMANAGPLPDAAPQKPLVASSTDAGALMSGPGSQFHRIGTLAGGSEVTLTGCDGATGWCQVSTNGLDGWARASDLGLVTARRALVVNANPDFVQVATVTPDSALRHRNAAAGLIAGAAMGAAVGGPFGAAAGAVVGMATGGIATGPKTTVTTYMTGAAKGGHMTAGEVAMSPPEGANARLMSIDGVPFAVSPSTRTTIGAY